jgi:hypothetical protein
MKFTEIENIKEVALKKPTFVEKLSGIKTIVDWAIEDDCRNELYFDMISKLMVAKLYFDVEFDVDLEDVTAMTDAYEKLILLRFDEIVYHTDAFDTPYCFLMLAEKQVTNEIQKRNSIAIVLKEGIEKLIEKIPNIDSKQIDKWMKALPKQMDKLSPENKELLLKVVGK